MIIPDIIAEYKHDNESEIVFDWLFSDRGKERFLEYNPSIIDIIFNLI